MPFTRKHRDSPRNGGYRFSRAPATGASKHLFAQPPSSRPQSSSIYRCTSCHRSSINRANKPELAVPGPRQTLPELGTPEEPLPLCSTPTLQVVGFDGLLSCHDTGPQLTDRRQLQLCLSVVSSRPPFLTALLQPTARLAASSSLRGVFFLQCRHRPDDCRTR